MAEGVDRAQTGGAADLGVRVDSYVEVMALYAACWYSRSASVEARTQRV